MDRHFLIAVSDQKSALHGVRFVSDFFSDKRHVKSTLFYSTPKPAPVFADERSFEAGARQKEQQRKWEVEMLENEIKELKKKIK